MRKTDIYRTAVVVLFLTMAGCAEETSAPTLAPTDTIQATDTLIPSDTPTLVPPTATNELTLDYSLEPLAGASEWIILSEVGFTSHYAIEISSGTRVKIENPDYSRYRILGYSDDCSLVVSADDRVIQTDLIGNEIAELFSFNYAEDEFLFVIVLSPDMSSVAYIVGSGYQDYASFEFQDIYLQRGVSGEVFPVTQHAGGYAVAWSADGDTLAYSDYDQNGIQQLYLIDPTGGDRRQVSSFNDPEMTIWGIHWSETGSHLLIELSVGDAFSQLAVVDLQQNENELQIIEGFSEIKGVWWVSDRLIALQATMDGDSDGIYLYDLQSNEVVDKVLESDFGQSGISLAKSFGSPYYAAFFSFDTLYVYDFSQSQLHKYEHVTRNVDFGDWFAIPSLNANSENCVLFYP